MPAVLAATAAAKAAHAAGSVGSAAATAAGFGMGKTDMDLTRELFKLQMRQAKRLWAADWAENSIRHGESCMQSAHQHAESQAMAHAAYYQAEKLALEGIKLARDQDSRAYEIAWRTEVRESLRDELANQFNRYNIVMLCDTVCLGCVFSLVAEAGLPDETPPVMINLYVLSMGITIMLFTISLWCAVMAVRRLYEHTAAILERKLFALSEELQKRWQDQLGSNLPTGAHESNLLNTAYEKWVEQHLKPIGEPSIHMMSFGVVMMFITAGLLTHNIYLIQYNSIPAVIIFWSLVLITSVTVIYMKYSEDYSERRKMGVYDKSWQDTSTLETGPFAKISRAGKDLFSEKPVEIGRMERMESLSKKQREFCTSTRSLHHGVRSLREDSKRRAKTRKDVLQLVTTAAEELDALPEELTALVNKLLYQIDEADNRTAEYVTLEDENDDQLDMSRRSRTPTGRHRARSMSPGQSTRPQPIDVQGHPVFLGLLRNKLGESHITTLLRLRNSSNEPLRLISGVQLKEGQYVKRLKTTDSDSDKSVYHLYPRSEIPPWSEVVVAARNNGKWVATSGIQGEICYTNREETWNFRITFRNQLVRRVRDCQVLATFVGEEETKDDDEIWVISKEELDIKTNSEVLIEMKVQREGQGGQTSTKRLSLNETLKTGFLFKQRDSRTGFGVKREQKWVSLTSTGITYSTNEGSTDEMKIALEDITDVCKSADTSGLGFEVHSCNNSVDKFLATTPMEQNEWIRAIKDATGLNVITKNLFCEQAEELKSIELEERYEESFECIQNDGDTSVIAQSVV